MSSEHCARVKLRRMEVDFCFSFLGSYSSEKLLRAVRSKFQPQHVLSVTRRLGLSAYGCMPLLADKIGLLRRKLINKRI